MVGQTSDDFLFGLKVTDAITIKKYPNLDRFGQQAGKRNESRQALGGRVLLLTGRPDLGRTARVNAILLTLPTGKVRCLLCAPTRRADKRLSEAAGVAAKTIHRLLEVNPALGGFTRNEARRLECVRRDAACN